MTDALAWDDAMNAWKPVSIDFSMTSIVYEYDRTRSRARIDGHWLLLKLTVSEIKKLKNETLHHHRHLQP